MEAKVNLLPAKELYSIIEGNLESIIQDIYPLEYDKQKEAIKHIAEQISSNDSIQTKDNYPEIDEEITEINQLLAEQKKRQAFNQEEQKKICKQTAELIESEILENIGSSTELEKKYLNKLNQITSIEEKKALINEYKTSLQDLNKQNFQNLQKQQSNLRGRKEVTNVEEHKLVKEGIVTKEEIEPYLSNYDLLCTLAEHSHMTDDDGVSLVKKLFEAARNFYPDKPLQGLKDLMDIPDEKSVDLLKDNILKLLSDKQISFIDINYIESRELYKINEIDIKSNFKLIECVIAGICPLTLRKLIELGKIDNFDKKELELIAAFFEKDTKNLSNYQGIKISNELSKILLGLHESQDSTIYELIEFILDDLIQFINVTELGKEIFPIATFFDKNDIIRTLMEEKIDFYSRSVDNKVIVNFDEDIFRYLINLEEFDINAEDKNGNTLLHAAIDQGKSEVVKFLTSYKNLEVNTKDLGGNSPLHLAIKSNNPEIVEMLLSYENINVNEKDKYGDTTLHKAIRSYNHKIIEMLLLREEIDVNEKDNQGKTPLHKAVDNDKPEIVKVLLSREDIKINELNKGKETALLIAFSNEKINIVKMLLSHKNMDTKQKEIFSFLEISREDEAKTPINDGVSILGASEAESYGESLHNKDSSSYSL
ncbi:ankyrin repeat domain-containing protein [Rickettsia bellii]|uniref:Ankyrin repeat family protein n=1 Tax=Rickettsia bellii str. RML Mogi TaxID=1359194 RepID=A0A0F3QJF0_RICBE|nr:ankyrin repeat domain-containing protein [Rickettsia bellii]KJV92281.1 ankyrin repeat family protein [Rickettsia bellii str. RML Mogi]